MALTSDRKIATGPQLERRCDKAVAGTYYVGQLVEFDASQKLVTTGSIGLQGAGTAGDVCVGFVEETQVVPSGGSLRYTKGQLVMPVSAEFTSPGQKAYLAADFSATPTASTNTMLGRFDCPISGSGEQGVALINVGDFASGSL